MAESHGIGGTLRRWVLRGLVSGLCLLLALAAALALWLPWLAERLVERELARRGLANVTARVQQVAWDRSILGPVAVRDAGGLLQVDTVAVRYRLQRLRQGQIDEVRLTGVRLPVRRRGQAWVPAGLETLRRIAAPAQPHSGAPAARGTAGGLTVVLQSSQIEVRDGSTVLLVPVQGTVRLPERGPCRVQATVWLQGAPVMLTAEVDLDRGDGTAALTCPRADLAGWLRVAALLDLGLPDTMPDVLSGQASWRATATIAGRGLSRWAADAVVSHVELRTAGVPVSLQYLDASLHSGPDLRDAEVILAGRTGPVVVGDLAVAPLAFSGNWRGDRAEGALEGLDLQLRDGFRLRGQAQWLAEGTRNPASARLQLGVEVAELALPAGGPLAGRLDVAGTPQEVHLGGLFEVARPDALFGLGTLVVDAQARLRHGVEAELAATALVHPAPAATAWLPGVAVSGSPVPVELAAALLWPPDGEWRCSGAVGIAGQRLGVQTGTINAGADVSFEGRVGVTPDRVTATGRLDLAGLQCEGYGATATVETLSLSVAEAWCPLPQDLQGDPLQRLREAVARLTVEGRVELRGGALQGPGNLTCQGIALDLPAAWHSAAGVTLPADAAGSAILQTGPVRLDAVAASGLRAWVSLEGYRVRVQGELTGERPAVTVELDTSVDWSHGLTAALHYRVPPFQVGREDTWYRSAALPAGLRLAGLLSAEGDILFDARELQTPCRVVLADGALDWSAQMLTIAGIAGELQWRDLLRLQTAPFQEVRFASATVHDVPVDGGQIVFQLDGSDSFCLERCELNWCKGLVHTQAVRINPADPAVDLVLFAENVDFVTALTLIKGFKGKGTGVLNGKLPISYRHGRLGYSRGYLYSIPGQEGRLELQSAGLLTSAVPPDHPSYNELRRAEKALEEFRLDLFRLDFVGRQAGEPGAQLLLVGEGVRENVPVRLNLNVNGAIEDAINMGLRLGGM